MKQHIHVVAINGVESLQLLGIPSGLTSDPITVVILLADVEAAIAAYRQGNRLVARKRLVHGIRQYWIGRGKGRDFVLYYDIYSPTGYGFRSQAKAEQIASEIEERIKREKEEREKKR